MKKPKADYVRDAQGNPRTLGDMIKASMTVLEYGRWLAQQKAN
jgi:hypothetical protein